MYLVIKILFVSILISGLAAAQEIKDKAVAKIGNKEITTNELKERYELMPQVGRHIKNREYYLKAELLYSIISEKLWALEAEHLGLDTTDIMNYSFKTLEKMYWRDALYSDVVKNKADINADDVFEARKRVLFNLIVHYIYAESKNGIDSLHQILNNGFPFDSLLEIRPEYALQDTPYVVTYGQMDKFVEDSLYNLKIGEYTSPVKSPEGWYIFKLDSIVNVVVDNARTASSLEKNIRKTTESRAIDEAYTKYYRSFFKGKTINSDGELFWSLSNKIIEILFDRAAQLNPKPGEKVHMEPDDYYRLEREVGADTLNMPFIKFSDTPVTLKQFIHEFVFEGFYTDILNADIIRAKLNSRVKRFIEQELLAREAYKNGFQNNPQVKYYIDMWRDNYLATLYKSNLLRQIKVSDDEVLANYRDQNTSALYPAEVNIVEILTDDLEVIELILRELDKGIRLRELAALHTKRLWTKSSDGEFGFFPTTAYGEIGRIAGGLEIGEIYGPLKVDEGYSIFQVIDKREPKKELPKSFEEIKEQLKQNLKGEKASDILINKTVELANKYGVTIDENLLYSLKVSNLTMFTYRFMGFGGRILAVPLTNPFILWVEKWQHSKDSLP